MHLGPEATSGRKRAAAIGTTLVPALVYSILVGRLQYLVR